MGVDLTNNSRPYGIIPARAQSTRFPRKVIATICDKPMIQYVWESAQAATTLGGVMIATDDEAVLDVARGFGADAHLTPNTCESGTDRVAFLAKNLDAPIIVNLQGDEPLLPSASIDALVEALEKNPQADMATLAVERNDPNELLNPNVVKVVFNKKREALYFSRKALATSPTGGFYKHIGIYAYRREALLKFCQLPHSSLEITERLEQLRALENGMRCLVVLTDCDTVAVDTPEDIEKVEQRLRQS